MSEPEVENFGRYLHGVLMSMAKRGLIDHAGTGSWCRRIPDNQGGGSSRLLTKRPRPFDRGKETTACQSIG